MGLMRGMALAIVLTIAGASAAVALDISEDTNANYQDYLKIIGSTKKGAFAVSENGVYSWFIYCTDANCIPDGIGRDALAKCQSFSGQRCQLMAYGRDLRIPITVVPKKTKASDEILAAVLDAEHLKQVVVGNTLQGEYPNNKKWYEYYDASGAIRGKDDNQGSYTASYALKGDEVCFDYEGTYDDWCAKVSMRGNRVEFLHKGEVANFARNTIFLDGNPNGL